MNYIEIIQDSIDYIEENLKSEITANELANISGFSLFHYYRVFQKTVGIPVMQYILRRKLSNAIYEISLGNKIIDVALKYGFDTHAGFFKAFKREYDCSPTYYLKNYKANKPYRINLIQEEMIMISDKKIREVLTNWELNEPISVKDMYYESRGSKAENTWIINDKYVLKVGTNIEGIKRHIKVSEALNDVGIEGATPITTKGNQKIIIDGDIYFYLSTCIEGNCLKSNEFFKDDYEPKSRYFGEVIGHLHRTLEKFDKEFIANEPNLLATIEEWAIPEAKKHMNLPDCFYSDYLEDFKKLYCYLTKHIIHRDINPSNIIIKENNIASFLDFELTECNIRIYDPCYAATAILSESFGDSNSDNLSKWINIYRNITIGYDSICKLTDEERQAIPYVIFAIQFVCVAYFSDKDKFQELAKINQKMLQWLYDNREQLSIKK